MSDPIRDDDSTPPPVGNPADDARAAAVQEGVTAAVQFNDADDNKDDDVARKAAADQAWAQRSGVIENHNQQHYNDCLAALNTAASAIATETTQCAAAAEHIGAGQTLVAEGDQENAMMAKIAKYNAAKDHYLAAQSACSTAGSAHNQADAALDTAEAILSQYG